MQDDFTTKNKSVRQRRIARPGIDLEKATEYSKKLNDSFGAELFSKESAVKEIGHPTLNGSSSGKIAALVHYGLLEKVSISNSYQNSELATKILYPINDTDKINSLRKAAKNPKLFKDLINQFTGKSLPTALESILIREHKISLGVAKMVSKNFRKTVAFADLYTNRIIQSRNKNEKGYPDTEAKEIPQTQNTREHKALDLDEDMQKITLPSEIKIYYPESLSYEFATGKFGRQIKELERAINKERKVNSLSSALSSRHRATQKRPPENKRKSTHEMSSKTTKSRKARPFEKS